MKINKRAQLTIFVILAILIVVLLLGLVWLLRGRVSQESILENPESFIDNCVRDAVEQEVGAVLVGGGKIEPEFYKSYLGEKYNYLCYQKSNYLSCINQYPMLKDGCENEIGKKVESKIENCFEVLKDEFEKSGYDISLGNLKFDVQIVPGKIWIRIIKKVDIVKDGNSQSFEKFESFVLSPAFNLISIAREIVNQESQFCNFDYGGFMVLYPDYNIRRISYDDSRIYIVEDRKSEEKFKFAVRGCALPAGI